MNKLSSDASASSGRILDVRVRLLGSDYTIKCPEDAQSTLNQAVAYLNEKLEETKDRQQLVSNDKIAMMTALDVAYELFTMRVGERVDIAQFQRKIIHLNDQLDEVLERLPLSES